MTLDNVSNKETISKWLVDWIANELDMAPAEIDTSRSLLEYSMSSVTATILVGDLEDWLDLHLPPTLVWDYPSIDGMTDFLMTQIKTDGDAAPAAAAPEAAEGQDAAALLENIENLSEEEVDRLLKQLEAAEQG